MVSVNGALCCVLRILGSLVDGRFFIDDADYDVMLLVTGIECCRSTLGCFFDWWVSAVYWVRLECWLVIVILLGIVVARLGC